MQCIIILAGHSLNTQGRTICRKAFSCVLGISLKCLKSIFNDYKTNIMYVTKAKKVKHSDKHDIALAWMRDYFSRFGENMPHVSQVRNYLGSVCLYVLTLFIYSTAMYKRQCNDSTVYVNNTTVIQASLGVPIKVHKFKRMSKLNLQTTPFHTLT